MSERWPRMARACCRLFPLLVGTACTAPTTTQRVVAGRTLEGRYIAPEAYAAVMKAELLAAQGKTAQAHAAYQEASDVVGYSPEVWTRLGALACRIGLDHGEAFAKAEARDQDYEPLWRERAECALAHGDASSALQAAERAAALDPNQPRNTRLAARALSQLRQTTDAIRWQHALELRNLRKPTPEPTPEPVVTSNQTALDQALHAHDLPRARRYALRARLDATALALHALRLGLPAVALEQAQLVLTANPLDADARVAALCAADLLHDTARMQALLVTPLSPTPLRPSAEAELARLLSRHAPPDEASTSVTTEQ